MIKLQNIDKAYEGVPLFQNFTLEFAPHQVHSIVGPSGVGKTTLINLLAGLALSLIHIFSKPFFQFAIFPFVYCE